MSLNKVILVGNVGQDPQVRYFDNGNAVANFRLATTERGYRTQNGTEVPERTEWHNIVANRERAQFVEKYIKKGSGIYVEGKLRYRDYEDKDGVRKYVTEIVADRIEFFNFGRRPEGAGQNAQNATQAAAASAQPTQDVVAEGSTDDLPF
ncbi:MAG: single-stranded DNA-binding protein [Bacteroidales bacterium]|jgi:single-strand DNA-binding protein|nr:single-stranded DNA-binding protein [Bacteroidales bacterium]MBP5135349.1 single-stranded DNA-binding protein [Paludibacteraceae bacterium]MDD6357493.1 single-stranded DNA-binding protein [Bacteroidales bacterium]